MQRHLLSLLNGEVAPNGSRTASALRARQMIDDDGGLTPAGWVEAVLLANLETQCDKLGLTLEDVKGLKYQGKPEKTAYQYLSDRGYSGGYCEGGVILLLIRSAALETLVSLNTFGSREDAKTRFTEAQLAIHADRAPEICNAIRRSTTTDVKNAFGEIYSSDEVSSWYPGLDTGVMAAIFDAIGNERLARIAEVIAEAPYDYRSGWPDLTMVNDAGEVLWMEVKTTDRLHLSQVNTIKRMKPLLPGKIGVIRLS